MAGTNDRSFKERVLSRIDAARPYVRNAVIAAAPTAALARAYELKRRPIIALTSAAAGAGMGDTYLSERSKERALKPILKNYALEQKMKTASLADFLPRPAPVTQKEASRPPEAVKVAEVTDLGFLDALRNAYPRLQKQVGPQCHVES